MPIEQNTVSAFQKNRAVTWKASKPWLLLMLIGAIGSYFVGDLNSHSSFERWLVWLLCFVLFGASIARLIFIVRTHYRCPACGEVPMSGWASLGSSSLGYERGVDLNPSQCPSCGVKLK